MAATMYPERLPESVLRDEKRAAERRVYEALSTLDREYRVFYSVAWQTRRPGSNAKDGEADFVVVHPDLGVLVLEVKGGRIAYDARTSEWTSTDRYGQVHSLKKDPAQQALGSVKALLDKLRDMPGWDGRWLTIGHAVVFPDVHVGQDALRLDLPREIVFDADDVRHIRDAVGRVFRHYGAQNGRGEGLGRDRVEIAERLLARSFQLETPLGVELEYEYRRLVELTEHQMGILNWLGTRRRAAIQGCAGSGKTMLALNKAACLAEQGFDVLLTCYNHQLSQYLAGKANAGVEVKHFHGLCRMLAKKAKVSIDSVGISEDTLYQEVMPSALLQAIDRDGPRYDAIVVDEGQDFREQWWFPLVSLLRDPDQGILFVFFDDNQNLYQSRIQIPGVIEELPFSLNQNCRNTQGIHRVVASFHHNPDGLSCPGPVGRPPEVEFYRGDRHQMRQAGRVLHRLINEGRVDPREVVLLTPRSQDRSIFRTGTQVGRYTLTTQYPPQPEHIQVSSVHGFKGLERQVVVLAEIDRVAGLWLDELLYVGCSRARTHLVLLVDTEAPQSVKARVQQAVSRGD